MQELGLLLLKVVVTPIVYNICTKTGVLLGTKKSFATPTRTGTPPPPPPPESWEVLRDALPANTQTKKQRNKQTKRERAVLSARRFGQGKAEPLSFLCAFSHVVAE